MNPGAGDPVVHFSWFDWGITPWTILCLCLIPLMLLVVVRKTYPTTRFAALAVVPLLLALPLPDWWWLLPAGLGAGLAFLGCIDLITVPNATHLRVHREMARVSSLGKRHAVELQIDNRGKSPVRLCLADDAVDGLSISPEKHAITVSPGKRLSVKHVITPGRRGAFELQFVYSHLFSQGGLWRLHHDFPCVSQLHVYPDIKQIGEYALLARTNRLSQIGVRRTRKAGQDNNFERLRDFQHDDNYKHIDWRSTARRQKLTVRQFQTDQSQRVIFLLDCGRMMTNEHNGLSLLDYALNSVLMLSYVALSQGDSVGMVCFSDRIHAYVPPASGKRQMNRLLHAGFDQFPELVQSRFDEAFLYLSQHCRKRSLVVLVSNVIDQVNAQQIENYMQNLVGCHLPLLVLLRDHRLFDAADNPAPDPLVLSRSAAASQILLWRHQVIRGMRARGALTLDVFPDEMTSPLVNQYLEVKARHLL